MMESTPLRNSRGGLENEAGVWLQHRGVAFGGRGLWVLYSRGFHHSFDSDRLDRRFSVEHVFAGVVRGRAFRGESNTRADTQPVADVADRGFWARPIAHSGYHRIEHTFVSANHDNRHRSQTDNGVMNYGY